MMNNDQGEGYAALVAEAEAAVASVKDPELRRVAFEKILETLLEQSSTRSSTGGTGRSKRRSKKNTLAKKARTKKARSKKARARKGPKSRVAELIDDGFFKKQRTIADVKAELANRGHHIAITSLSGPLQSLTQDRRLRRQRVTGASKGTKGTFAYSNW